MTRPRTLTLISALALTVTLLGGCTVPVLSDPPPVPSGPQKSITELRTQTVDLLQDAITATGTPTGWLWTTVSPEVPFDHDIENTQFRLCSTGQKRTYRISGDAYHDPIDEPHVTADILTGHWRSQGFTVRTVIDGLTQAGNPVVERAAERADGVSYDLMVTTDVIAIHAYSECSTHPSFQDVIDHVGDPPTTPTPTP